MDIKEAIAFGQYSGHESPQRILAEKVLELERENAKWKAENTKLWEALKWAESYVPKRVDCETRRMIESLLPNVKGEPRRE
jgi:hypothetical protein